MAPKRKRKTLTVAEKYKILELIDNNESDESIAEKFGIGIFYIKSIKAKRQEITKYFKTNSASGSSSTKRINSQHIHTDLNRLLREWYIRCTEKDINLTGLMIQVKALELNKQLKGNTTFKGSLRWVSKFRKRYSLRKADIDKDLEIPNQAAADTFKAEFNELIQKGEYRLENVYNAEATGLEWKAIPKTSLITERLKSLGKKRAKDPVTTFLCANATGCHKLPILIISMSKDAPTINSYYANVLSIMYKTNNKPYMDNNIFNEWFNECFLKSVIERQQKNGHREKTLLLLNNAGLEHENTIISTKDEFVKIMHFSYDAAPLIQPMDCGIIACFKRMYRNDLLRSLMPRPTNVSEEEFIRNYYKLKIDDCCRMINNAWLTVKNPILKNAWNKLLKDEGEQSSEDPEIIKKDINEALANLNKLPGCEGCDSTVVMDWFETDKKHNTGIQIDIKQTLIDFINVAMDTEPNQLTDENFEDICDI